MTTRDTTGDEVPPEFEIDTSRAAPLGEWDLEEHLEQLWSLRGNMTHRARRELESAVRSEENLESVRSRQRKTLATAVSNADELRLLAERLVPVLPKDPAERGSPDDESSESPAVVVEGQGSGWLGWIFGSGRSDGAPSGASTKAVPHESADVLGRLWRMTRNRLEQIDVHYVPLLGRDLREVEFEGQPVKRWVSVKNKSRSGEFVVESEIQGLWVQLDGDSLAPVQRGEVLLR